MADPVPTKAPPASFPVRTLRFVTDIAVELPGQRGGGSSSVTSRPPDAARGARYAIAFYPAMRHHRIDYWAPGLEKDAPPTETRNVWEGHVSSWEPA
jgi:hypothetical protein